MFGWDAYGQLLAGVYEDKGGVSTEDVQTISAGMRRQIARAAAVSKVSQGILNKRLAELDKDVEKLLATKAERRAANVAEFAKTWGPAAAGVLLAWKYSRPAQSQGPSSAQRAASEVDVAS